MHPGQAVGDEWIAGLHVQSGLDQGLRFFQLDAAISVGVPQCVVRMLEIGFALDDVAQQALHLAEVSGSFREQGGVVGQLHIIGCLAQQLSLQRIGFLVQACVAQ